MEAYRTDQWGSLREPLQTITTHDLFALVTVRGSRMSSKILGCVCSRLASFSGLKVSRNYVIDRAMVEEPSTGRIEQIKLTKTQQVHVR
jgi:hypothetical protein